MGLAYALMGQQKMPLVKENQISTTSLVFGAILPERLKTGIHLV
jgi:hypothetical protein